MNEWLNKHPFISIKTGTNALFETTGNSTAILYQEFKILSELIDKGYFPTSTSATNSESSNTFIKRTKVFFIFKEYSRQTQNK